VHITSQQQLQDGVSGGVSEQFARMPLLQYWKDYLFKIGQSVGVSFPVATVATPIGMSSTSEKKQTRRGHGRRGLLKNWKTCLIFCWISMELCQISSGRDLWSNWLWHLILQCHPCMLSGKSFGKLLKTIGTWRFWPSIVVLFLDVECQRLRLA